PLECLLFMRDVRSRSYFEQMKGRGTRVLTPDDLRKVTPSASAKTHYVIVDAVGVTRSMKTASQPLDTKPSVPFKDLATGLMMGDRSEETVSSLAGRLARLDSQLEAEDQAKVRRAAGKSLSAIVRDLFDAIDPDRVEADAIAAGHPEPDESAMRAAREARIGRAANVFTGPVIELMDTIRRNKEQTIDHDSLDTLHRAEWAGDVAGNAGQIARDFEEYLTENRERIEALVIYFSQPARRAEVTHAMVKDLLARLIEDRPRLAPLTVWRAYEHLDDYKGRSPVNELTALVALVRRVCGLDETLIRHSDRVRRNFQDWILNRHAGSGEKFSEEQMVWLRMIRDHLEISFTIERDDLEMAPFDVNGGLGRMYALFGDGMDEIMSEMNEALAA
ncbi:MAG: restriction endonuclease subunit R, partial [Gammaproteobacteria bacterium]|nr:restriction endonuclease subunit R [Gammaproteobacteria bacterium]